MFFKPIGLENFYSQKLENLKKKILFATKRAETKFYDTFLGHVALNNYVLVLIINFFLFNEM